MTVFIGDGGPEEGCHELGEEESGDQETGGEADVGPFRKFVETFDHEEQKWSGDVGGEKLAEEGDGEDDHWYLWERSGINVVRLL